MWQVIIAIRGQCDWIQHLASSPVLLLLFGINSVLTLRLLVIWGHVTLGLKPNSSFPLVQFGTVRALLIHSCDHDTVLNCFYRVPTRFWKWNSSIFTGLSRTKHPYSKEHLSTLTEKKSTPENWPKVIEGNKHWFQTGLFSPAIIKSTVIWHFTTFA